MVQLSIDADLDNAENDAFRARASSEYKRIFGWVGKKIDLQRAKILDFGCGQGIAAASFAMRHRGSKVIGFDVNPVDDRLLRSLFQKNIDHDPPQNVRFMTIEHDVMPDEGDFDLIYSWSVFEHIKESNMTKIFKELKARLRKGGLLFLQSNPLYFSPRGSHLYKYFDGPWHHLILPLDELRDGVFAKGVTETHSREWQQFLELNRLTAGDILGRASAAGLKRIRQQYFTSELVPPPLIARVYNHEVLATFEVMALFE